MGEDVREYWFSLTRLAKAHGHLIERQSAGLVVLQHIADQDFRRRQRVTEC